MFSANVTIFERNTEYFFKDALGNTYKLTRADGGALDTGNHYIEGLIRPSTYAGGTLTFVVLNIA